MKKAGIFLTIILVSVNILGCQVVQGDRSLSQYSKDSMITAKVKNKLLQSTELPGSQVHVETDQGVIILSGFVKNKYQITKASRIAKSIPGVRRVKNALETY